jgi:cytochrome bd-type quinol oxidase subunit 1
MEKNLLKRGGAISLILIISVLVLIIPMHFALSQEFVPLEPLPGFESGESSSEFVNSVVSFTIAIGALLAVIMIVWGGIQYMTSNRLDSKSDARDIITSALSGLILILFSWILLNLINPDILNLNFFSSPRS